MKMRLSEYVYFMYAYVYESLYYIVGVSIVYKMQNIYIDMVYNFFISIQKIPFYKFLFNFYGLLMFELFEIDTSLFIDNIYFK